MRINIRAFFFALSMAYASGASAQTHWSNIAWFNQNVFPYFVNENYGFIFTSGGRPGGETGPTLVTDTLAIYRTTDGGSTWMKMDLGNELSGQWGLISSMAFVTPSHGYAFVVLTLGPGAFDTGAIYHTLDSGRNWSRISPLGYGGGRIYAKVPSSVFVASGFSTNEGATWASMTPKADDITGNGESLLFVVGGGSGALYSTDLGASWSNSHMDDWNPGSFSGWVILHTTTIIRACEEAGSNGKDSSTIQTSTDGGATFWTRFRRGPSENIDYITGDGCVVYVQSGLEDNFGPPPYGILRSTDFGQTWITVGGPDHEQGSRTISVTGHGAVVYALDDGNYLWKTTDGGDGTLSSAVHTSVTTGHSLAAGAIGDTLVSKLCDSTSLSLWLRFAADNCDYGGLYGVAIDGLDSSTAGYGVTLTQYPWSYNKPDTAWASIYPRKPGIYPLSVHALYTDDDHLGGDTTFSIILVIKDNPGTLAATPSAVDFGTESLCSPKTLIDTVSISASGCEAVTIDSIVFSPRGGGNNFTFKPVTKGFALGASGGVRKYPVGYLASLPETDSGAVLVYSSNGIDTIQVRGAGAENSRSFVAATDTARAAMCDSATATVTLQNTTCGILVIDSITIPNDFSIPLGSNGSPQLPLGLGKGQAGSVTLQFTPSLAFDVPGAGSRQAIAHVRLIELGDTLSFDTVLNIQTIIARGKPVMTLSTTALDFGSVSTCGQSVTLPVIINSTGCDTLIGRTGFSLSPPFRVVRGDSATLPVDASDTVSITFTPSQSGQFFDTLAISTNAGTGTVPLRGFGVADRVALALPATTLALPQVIAGCGADTATVFFSNAGCKSITIDSVVGLSAPFSAGTISNQSLATKDTAYFKIYYVPTSTGLKSGATRVFYHGADGISRDTSINISATATQPPSLSVYLKSASLSAKDQEVVSIPVYASSTSSVSGIGSISFRLDMRTDLLTPETVSSSILGAGTAPLQVDANGASITLTLPATFSISSETIIAEVNCMAYVTDTSHGTISLSNLTSNGSANCLSVSGEGEESFTLIPECGNTELTHFLSTGKIFTIESIVPNPAQTSIQVLLSKADRTPVTAELYDILGTRVLTSAERNPNFTLDLTQIAGGSYYLRLSMEAETLTRKIEVVR